MISSGHFAGTAAHRLARSVASMAAAFIVFGSAHAAGNVERFTCHRLSGGRFVRAITLTFDYAAKTVATSPDGLFEPVPDTIEVTDAKVDWGYMRGYAVFDRRTHVLDWDATAEYDYLDAISQTPAQSRDDFKGRMQCEAAAAP